MTHRARRWLRLAVGAALLVPVQLWAQLRPLEPIEWAVFEPGNELAVRVGVGRYWDQRASLAGVDGRLTELADFSVVWRTDRVALEAAGTVLRLFDDEEVFAAPVPGTSAPSGRRRHDSGDYRVAATLRLTPALRPAIVALRFGTRLPTTDNRIGLDRDQTDFFAVLGGRFRRAGFSASGEAGVGINGTREPNYEQSDVLVYALSAAYRIGSIMPSVIFLGQVDGLSGRIVRGNEDLAELRIGVQAGLRRWVRVSFISGLRDASPRAGVSIYGGIVR
jgi:hypothetical protein